ncbi:MAG: MFS transporter, partial [Acidimicrobiia bacterium]
ASATLWSGAVAAAAMLLSLAMFAISRSLSSISAKDVIGKTIPKGQRGSITGIAAAISGVIAIAAGGAVALLGGKTESTLLVAIVAGAAALWVAAGGVFATIEENRSSHDDTIGAEPIVSMLRRDPHFRRFIAARSLLLVTALSPPLVIALAASTSATLRGLGPFVIAAGTASFLGSPVWGRLSDHSSRSVMAAAALGGGVIVFVFLFARQLVGDPLWLTVTIYFLLAVAHAGARMGRKTYVVDMGTGDQRTNYVAASNTVIGVVLLGTGAISTLTGVLGSQLTLGGLALAGVAGAFAARGLPEVEKA